VFDDNEIGHKSKTIKDNVYEIENVKEFVYVVGEKFKFASWKGLIMFLCEKHYLWWSR